MKSCLRAYKKGEFLIHQNEESQHMFVIRSGRVRIFHREGNFVVFTRDLEPGSIVGEVSLIDHGPRSASVVALEETEATIVFKSEIDEVNKKLPAWLSALARSLANRLRAVDDSIERDPATYYEAGIASLLVYQVEASKKNEFHVNNLIKTFSGMLRVSLNAVDEFFNHLASEHYIKLVGSSLFVENPEKLKNLVTSLRKEALKKQAGVLEI